MDSVNPRFSIVIPTFNRRDLLGDAILSVLEQSFQDFELIIVDNGSTDDTEQSVSKYTDSRIRYHRQDGSGSPASPRNTGIRMSRGEWVAFLDSDDTWAAGKLGVCWGEICRSNPDLLVHWQDISDFDGGTTGALRPWFPARNAYHYLLTHENTLATSATMVRRSFLLTHDLLFSESYQLIAVEDYDLWLRIASRGGVLRSLEMTLGTNRVHAENTGSSELFYRNLKNLVSLHANEIQRFEADPAALESRLLANIMLMECATHFRCGQFRSSFSKLADAARSAPLQPLRYGIYRLRNRLNPRFSVRKSHAD